MDLSITLGELIKQADEQRDGEMCFSLRNNETDYIISIKKYQTIEEYIEKLKALM